MPIHFRLRCSIYWTIQPDGAHEYTLGNIEKESKPGVIEFEQSFIAYEATWCRLLIWSANRCFRIKNESQYLHWIFLGFSWTTSMCFFKLQRCVKLLKQIIHLWLLDIWCVFRCLRINLLEIASVRVGTIYFRRYAFEWKLLPQSRWSQQ